MSMTKAALLSILIPVALAAPLAAQERGPDGPRMIFEELDADGNGAVTLEELAAAGDARFVNTDTNGDGQLSRDELLARAAERNAERVDRMIERADTNGDGALTQAELDEAREGRRRGPDPERMFERMDADGDGSVTEAEFDEAVSRLLDRMGRRHGSDRR
ncbi:EF-hand domain-containing protein [Gymnodinialimonas sp. 2305UL16-5]|uniref:EF-hand domain-containing protein n=1 Tax=Gymnodinialimonas mytili TaxID=3126503 RepID=UPI00309AB5B5